RCRSSGRCRRSKRRSSWQPLRQPPLATLLSPALFRNVELTAFDRDRAATIELCRSAGAMEQELLHHRDTYFAVSAGRLKLRQALPSLTPAVLVAYRRSDVAEARLSAYH